MSVQASEHSLTPTRQAPSMAMKRAAGPLWWLRSYWLMVQWDVASLRLLLPMMLAIQVVSYSAFVIALGLFYDEVPAIQAIYLATGSPVMAMVTIGMTIVPSIIAQRKADGAFDYVWSLPAPRLAITLATLTVFTLVALPGAAIALGIAVLRYDISLDVSPLLPLVALLVLLTSASLGVVIGHFAPGPVITGAISNLLFVFIFLFSPLNYPAERLPGWLQAVHDWLPFQYMADAVRGSLTDDLDINVGRSIAVLAVWAILAWALTFRILQRRR